MMFTNVTVELSGIKRIVVEQTKVYDRLPNNDWIERKTGKVVADHIMVQRIKKMLNVRSNVYGDLLRTDYHKSKVYLSKNVYAGSVKKYRMWINMETINIDKVIV